MQQWLYMIIEVEVKDITKYLPVQNSVFNDIVKQYKSLVNTDKDVSDCIKISIDGNTIQIELDAYIDVEYNSGGYGTPPYYEIYQRDEFESDFLYIVNSVFESALGADSYSVYCVENCVEDDEALALRYYDFDRED